MAMIRHHASTGAEAPVRLLYSSRSIEDVIYKDELARLPAGDKRVAVAHTLTRSEPPGWDGYARRIDGEMVAEMAWPKKDAPAVFICGPTAFVETAAGLLVESGDDAAWIRTERFWSHRRMTRRQSDLKLDGNAIAGLLGEIFTMEMTTAHSTCAGCGKVHAAGSVDVYLNAPGAVVRCPACEQVLLRIVHGRGRYWVDLTGTRCLEFEAPTKTPV